jgi:hypothetical protein
MKAGIGRLAIGNFVAEVGKTLGLPGTPELKFVVERKLLTGGSVKVCRRLLGIEGGERGRIARENSGAPLVEGGGRVKFELLGECGNGEKEGKRYEEKET